MDIFNTIKERQELEAEQILERLLNNQTVTRWACLKRRKQLFELINTNEKYESVADEVYLMIDLAKESL